MPVVATEVVWLVGNHDPTLPLSSRQGGGGMAQPDTTFRHIAEKAESGGEVSGHYHPKARIKTKAGVTGKCFIHDGRRLIMPAFGAYTGGLSVRHAQIADSMEIRRKFCSVTVVRSIVTPILKSPLHRIG